MSLPEIVYGPITDEEGRKWWRIRCPGCELVAAADEDQMNGRVSIDCPDCDYHETIDVLGLKRMGAGR